MRLFHFTKLCQVETDGTILTEGLKPAVGKQGIELPPHNVVWLTTQRDCMFNYAPDCCISLFIPSSDKRLVHWKTWLHQNGEHEIIAAAEETDREEGFYSNRSFYCYFGIVPPSAFRKIYALEGRIGHRLAWEPGQQRLGPVLERGPAPGT
jgi:hypothetical protein